MAVERLETDQQNQPAPMGCFLRQLLVCLGVGKQVVSNTNEGNEQEAGGGLGNRASLDAKRHTMNRIDRREST